MTLLGVHSHSIAAETDSTNTIEPDPQIQALIDHYIRTPAWTPESFQQLLALRQVQLRRSDVVPPPDRNAPPAPPAREGETVLILQAAYYAKRAPSFREEPNPGEEDVLVRDALTTIAHELHIPEVRVVAALLPYIETSDARLRAFIREDVLGDGQHSAFEKDQNDPKVAALFYLTFHSRMQKSQPWAVAQICFWKAPTASLMLYVSREGRLQNRDKMKAILWAQHTVEDVLWKQKLHFDKPGDLQSAIDELDKLSQFEEWWVKLYVAEMLRRHEELKDAKILERLRSDKNPLVAKAVDVPYREEEKKEDRGWFWP